MSIALPNTKFSFALRGLLLIFSFAVPRLYDAPALPAKSLVIYLCLVKHTVNLIVAILIFNDFTQASGSDIAVSARQIINIYISYPYVSRML